MTGRLWITMAAWVVAASAAAGQAGKPETAAALLEKGIYQEETVGDVDAAIVIYRWIAKDAQANRPFVAQALYRLGACYLKKGQKADAADAFRRLIEEYPEQKALVAQARRHMPAPELPEIVGCRIVEQVDLKLRPRSDKSAAAPGPSFHEFSRLRIAWQAEAKVAAKVRSFAVRVRSAAAPAAGEPETFWEAANLPATTRQVTYGEAAGRTLAPARELKAGPYVLSVYAFDEPQAALEPDKALAAAAVTLTVRPLIYTQIAVDDIQPDGTIRFRTILQQVNGSNQPLAEMGFRNSDFVKVERMTDDKGRPIQFTSTHVGNTYQYRARLNEPVPPGQPVLHASEGTMSTLIKRTGDEFQYYMRHWPGSSETRRVEIYHLPKGAELLATTPADMVRTERDGHIVLMHQKVIPSRGFIITSFRYRLGGAATAPGGPITVGYVDETAEGKRSIAGAGEAVLFDRPAGADRVVAVQVFASRYGTAEAPKEDFHVYLLDEGGKTIAEFAFPYGRIDRGEPRWYTLEVKPTSVPKKFHAMLSFDAQRTRGVYVSLDNDVKESHSYVGLPGRALRPLGGKQDWMIRVQMSPEAGAETAPAGETLQLLPAPWKDDELLQLVMKAAAGAEIGTLFYSAPSLTADGRKIWRIQSSMAVPVGNLRQYTRVDADAASFAPIFGRTDNSLLGDFRATYSPGKVVLTADKKPPRTIDLDGPIYDNEEVVYLIRRLPLAAGYEASIPIFPVVSGLSGLSGRIKVTERKKLTVPAGEFDCFKVDIEVYAESTKVQQQALWFSADEHRYPVKFATGAVDLDLARVGTHKADARWEFADKALGVSFEAPTGWYAWRSPGTEEGKAVAYLLAPEADVWATFSVRPRVEADSSARKVAEKAAETAKPYFQGYAIRPKGWEELKIAHLPAAAYAADYKEADKEKVEYRIYVVGKSAVYSFTLRVDKGRLEDDKKVLDSIAASLKAS